MRRNKLLALVLLSGVTLNHASPSARSAQHDVAVTVRAENDRLALFEAVKRSDLPSVRALLARHVVANIRQADGTTPLHWAANRGDEQIVQLLVRAGGDANAANRYGVMPLHLATEKGSARVTELLLNAGADPNAALPGGQTPLMTAARAGSPQVVRLLLEYGADVTAVENTRGQTALMWAAAEGHVSTIEALLAGGADLHAKSHGPAQEERAASYLGITARRRERLDAFTPLLFAVQAGHLDAVRQLIGYGAKVNDTAPDGTSALVLAIANGHYELAGFLLDKDANPNLAGQGWNAMVQLVRTRNPSVGQEPALLPTGHLSSRELAQKLIDHEVDVNARITQQIRDRYRTHLNMVGGTAYLMAAKAADSEMMRFLLTHGADPNIPTVAGRTALMVACGIDMWYVDEDSGTNEDAVEAVRVALNAGASINAINDDGDTALHGAAFRGSNEIVQMLVDRGARLDLANKLGFTPLMIANGDQRISCNLQRRPWTVELLTKMMVDRGLPALVRSDEEKFSNGVSTGYKALKSPKCE
jgi:ankyrin repeat protein